MTQGGGFEVGSDYVAARVSFDIDNTGVSSLKELSEELSKFRTATEAASRTGADFLKYLQQMSQLTNQATEAQSNLAQQLQRIADSQQALMTGQGTQVSRGVPQGYVNPFSGMGGGSGAGTASRPASVGDASNYLGNMAQQDPRQYFNMQANWGNVRSGDVPANSPSDRDLAQHAQRHHEREKVQNDRAAADPFAMMQRRISGMSSGASQLLNEMSPGSSNFGLASLGQQGLMSLSGALRQSAAAAGGVGNGAAPMTTAAQGMLGGVLSRGGALLGTGAGMAATGIGAAVGAGLLYQQGGEMIQGYRQMGAIRGGGASEGLGYEMSIRSMALNPFITTDQARQIVSAGLSSGYTGKEFDTLTQFMASNLQDMNMQVADSMKLFKKNVTEGGMTAEGLQTTLEGLKVGSKTGYATSQQLAQNYGSVSGAYIDAGVGGKQASREGAAAAFVFNDNAVLSEVFSQVASTSAGNTALGSLLMNPAVTGMRLPPGTTPNSVLENMPGGQNMATYKAMAYLARNAWQGSGGNMSIAVDTFTLSLRTYFPDVNWQSRTKIRELLTMLLNDPNGGEIKKAEKKRDESNREALTPKKRSTGQKVGGFLSGMAQSISAFGEDLKSNLFDRAPGEEWNWDKFQRADDSLTYSMTDERQITMEKLIAQYGSRGIEVGSGKSWKQLDVDNEQMQRDINSGKLKIRPKGDTSGGMSLKEIGTGEKSFGGPGGGGVQQVAPVYGTLNIQIDREGNVRAPQTVQLSSSEAGAREGAGGYFGNNPFPGERRRSPGL